MAKKSWPEYTGWVDRVTGAGAPRDKHYEPHDRNGPSTLKGLAADLNRAALVAPRRSRHIAEKSAAKVQRDWRKFYHATEKYFAAVWYPDSITKSVSTAGGLVTVDVGPDKSKRQGPLGNLIEFGSINNHGQHEGETAFRFERPKFVRRMEKLGAELLEGNDQM